MNEYLYSIILAVHIMSAAGWFGAMIYSALVLQPRARQFFNNTSQFEAFSTFLAAKSRWKVLSGIFLIGFTGILLWIFKDTRTTASNSLITIKVLILIIATGIFAYASWELWPARLMASAKEQERHQAKFRMIGITLITLCGAAFVISVFVK